MSLAVAGRAATWFVDHDAPDGGDGTTWSRALREPQAALDKAHAGDEVRVKAGVYPLDAPLRLPADIAFVGGFAGTEASRADRTGINFAHETTLEQRHPEASVVELTDGHELVLDGFTLTGARGRPALGLRRCANTVEIANCRIAKNTARTHGAGLSVAEQSEPRVFNCQVADNTVAGDGAGLFIDATSGGQWSWCIFNSNTAEGDFGGGALIQPGARPQFTRCDFYFNAAAVSGSALACGGGFELRDCVICSNLATGAGPGSPLHVQNGHEPLILSGESFVVSNLRDRAAPRFVPGVDDHERCTLRDEAIISPAAIGPADLTLFTARNDVHTVMYDVFPPPLTSEPPAAGRWVKQTLPAQAKTGAYHCLYLPSDWAPGKSFPILVGFPGNGPFRNRYGDRSGGLPEDNPMGFGVSGGRGFIVLGLGYLDSRKNLSPTGTWWGDVSASIAYAKAAVRDACERYGGDPNRVVLFGFSRSAIGASFIGLHDDSIATLWRAFLCYDGWEAQADMTRDWYRFDRSSYNYDPKDFGGHGVEQRFQRLAGRPLFILGGHGDVEALNARRHYPVELLPKPHRNHNVSWALRDTPERGRIRAWLGQVLATAPANER